MSGGKSLYSDVVKGEETQSCGQVNCMSAYQVEDEYTALAKAICNSNEKGEDNQSCGLVNWMSAYQVDDESTALEKAIVNSSKVRCVSKFYKIDD